MFIYFNENKCAYHKGQLAPFFIAFIIIIIIAALVTINIGKVAKDKTYSANSVDAGVLAAASTMASAFNYIAVANSNMEVNYQYFIGLATISFIIGYVKMATAMTLAESAAVIAGIACTCQRCCPDPPYFSCCACYAANVKTAAAQLALGITALEEFGQAMVSLLVQVIGYWMLQYFFYRMIRDNVEDYRQSAIDSGHSFSFSNSGISSKLRGCRAGDFDFCDQCESACDQDCRGRCGVREAYDDDEKDDYDDCMNYCTRQELNCLINDCQSQRAEYQLWVKNNADEVPSGAIITYSWLDEQERSHDVASQVMIDPVDDYILRHTVLPFPVEIYYLASALIFSGVAIGILTTAETKVGPKPCLAEMTIPTSTMPMIAGLSNSIIAHVGLAVNGTTTSSSMTDAWPYIIAWIDDVPHNHLVDVYQTQRHQGADLGAWSTEYPLTTSSSRASFAGTGKIYHPNPYYDSTMILTDFLTGHLLGDLAEPIKDVEGETEE